ncbi:MAG: hypothetical protein WCA77_10005 [Thermoplasmata archaeon]
MSTTSASGPEPAPVRAPPALDAQGRFVMHSGIPIAVIVFYAILILIIVYAGLRGTFSSFPDISYILVGILLIFLVRLLSTRYVLDSEYLRAWRLFGSRKVKLTEVRAIQTTSLRDLGPIGFFGTWGWRGRTWSPIVGSFDGIYTTTAGLLVKAGAYPLFLSPEDPETFARELSRRVRSYRGSLEDGDGAGVRKK